MHVNLDHWSSIIKEVPRSIEKRLSILSSSKNIFRGSAIFYDKYLKTVDIKLIYNTNQKQSKQTEKKT